MEGVKCELKGIWEQWRMKIIGYEHKTVKERQRKAGQE